MLVVHHVVLESTTISKDNLVVHHVVLESSMIKQVKRLNQLHVKVALWENTRTKLDKHRATTIV